MDLTEKRRIHEIARDEGLPSSLVLQRLKAAGLPIKTASSTVIVGEALHLLNPKRYARPDSLDATLAAAQEAKEAPARKAQAAKEAAEAEAAAKPKTRRARKQLPETPADQPVEAAPVEETPAAAEPQAPEAPSVEVEQEPVAPAAETPVAEAPAVETPVAEPPAESAPVAEAPVVAAPVEETPAPDAAPVETVAPAEPTPVAAVETPVAPEAAPAEPAPVAEEPVVEAPIASDPAVGAEGAVETAPTPAAAAPEATAPAAEAPAAAPAEATPVKGKRKIVPPAPAPPRPPLRRAEPAPPRPPLRRAADEEKAAAAGDGTTGDSGNKFAGSTGTGAGAGAGAARRPGERDLGPARGGNKRRRVVIDAQASRRGPGQQGRDRRGGRRGKGGDEREPAVQIPPSEMPEVDIRSGATIKEMAESLGIPATKIITTLMAMGEMATITQSLADEEMEVVAAELERKINIVHAEDQDEFRVVEEDDPATLVARAPVVTVMGHVDHGKTSLLDAIRNAEVVAGEAGGITQHIGAYQVRHNDRGITFLDTPGHEAFTAMRARGAKVTDVAVIVVAADDGVMPTTIEAIDHARAAEVPFMIAINKIDKPDANPDRVRQELSQREVIPVSWGGTHEFIEVSAKQGTGLENLLDTILLISDVDSNPQANPGAEASGSVIEARLDAGRGPVCTLLVQRGTLRVGDVLLVGSTFGRVRAMNDYKGDSIETAGPSVPVEVLGMDSVPDAGERFRTVENERVARQLAAQRSHRIRAEELANRRPVSLDDLFKRVQEGGLNELNLILKADVHGSVEALRDALEAIEQTEVRLRVIHTGVGAVTESDINLAAASDAIIIAFNVRPRPEAKALADREGVDVRTYRVIYRAIEDMRAALIGMLAPDIVEQALGSLEVRTIFRASRIGTIAGCYVTDGTIRRNANMRLVRDGTVVHEGKIGSLRRFDDDVREVQQGFECGVVLDGYNDVKEGDVIEAFEFKEVARTEQAPAEDSGSGA